VPLDTSAECFFENSTHVGIGCDVSFETLKKLLGRHRLTPKFFREMFPIANRSHNPARELTLPTGSCIQWNRGLILNVLIDSRQSSL
jgi:hypothetical protein